ncbi:hypothetical protein SAMN05880574_13117 [Chryseobacterium sp. RU37D]|nr:hypothetical protein SAMN05880574_13117 [Chryseobacterium sp. RU37D]
MKKTLLMISLVLANYLFSQQATYTMTSDVPIGMTSIGTDTYNMTVFYHNLERGLLIDLAKKANDITATPIDFSINARGGLNPFFTIKGNNGNLGIGTNDPQYKLDVIGKSSFTDNMKVAGKIEAKEIKVTTTPTADFVFEKDYNLPKLEDVEKHIKEKKHLPEIASARDMEKEGVNIGEFQIKLLQKIEELTLYSIEQNKQINQLKKQVQELTSAKK